MLSRAATVKERSQQGRRKGGGAKLPTFVRSTSMTGKAVVRYLTPDEVHGLRRQAEGLRRLVFLLVFAAGAVLLWVFSRHTSTDWLITNFTLAGIMVWVLGKAWIGIRHLDEDLHSGEARAIEGMIERMPSRYRSSIRVAGVNINVSFKNAGPVELGSFVRAEYLPKSKVALKVELTTGMGLLEPGWIKVD